MKKPITKRKISIRLDTYVHTFLFDKFENRSKYIECLIYKNLKDSGELRKDIII